MKTHNPQSPKSTPIQSIPGDRPSPTNYSVATKELLTAVQACFQKALDFRTTKGVADELGLPEPQIRAIFQEYPSLFRMSLARGSKGEELYALAAKPITIRERIASFQTFFDNK